MSPLLEYLRSFRRHGVAIVTGSFPIGLYTFLVLAYPDAGKVHYPWNHLPQWLVWTMGILALIVAQYWAWRDLRAERDLLKQGLEPLRQEREQLRGKVDVLEQQVNQLQTQRLTSVPGAVSSFRRSPESRASVIAQFERLIPKLEAEIFLDCLTYAWPKFKFLGPLYPEFMVVRVRNISPRNIANLVARCKAGDGEIRCVWSSHSGSRVTPGGNHSADITTGDSRLVVIAQCVKEDEIWLKLGTWASMPELVLKATSPSEGVRYAAQSTGEILNLGREASLDLTFTAEGVSESYRLQLGFTEGNEPTFSMRNTSP